MLTGTKKYKIKFSNWCIYYFRFNSTWAGESIRQNILYFPKQFDHRISKIEPFSQSVQNKMFNHCPKMKETRELIQCLSAVITVRFDQTKDFLSVQKIPKSRDQAAQFKQIFKSKPCNQEM